MIFKLAKLIKAYGLQIHGVIHIGAHYGEEYSEYKNNRVKNVMFIEPLPDNYRHLLDNLKADFPDITYAPKLDVYNSNLDLRLRTLNCAMGNSTGKINMHVETANKSQSSSILKPKQHLVQYPHIVFDQEIMVEMDKLDNLSLSGYNMINIDVQGYELEVFKGGFHLLSESIDYINSEVNRDELYEGCPMIEQLDSYLAGIGFVRILTDWVGKTWGDALYVKANLAPGKWKQFRLQFKHNKPIRKYFKHLLRKLKAKLRG